MFRPVPLFCDTLRTQGESSKSEIADISILFPFYIIHEKVKEGSVKFKHRWT